VRQGSRHEAILPLILDEGVPMNCAWIPTGLEAVRGLGSGFGSIKLEAA
jgi:hypothetical protein